MNGALTPALIAAAGGGSAMLAGIAWTERRHDEAMRSSRVALGLRFPAGLNAEQAKLALGATAGTAERLEYVFEVSLAADRVAHYLLVPELARSSVAASLTSAMPGLRTTDEKLVAKGRSLLALRLFVPTPATLTVEHPETPLATLAGLPLAEREQIVVRWAVRPARATDLPEADSPDAVTRERERTWRAKTQTLGFCCSGLVLIRAATPTRARELAGHVESIYRGRRGSLSGLRLTSERSGRRMGSLPQVKRSSGWLNLDELLGLLMLPVGEAAIPGLEVGGRELPVPADVPCEGRPLFVGRDRFGRERPIALDDTAARHHLVCAGPSGSGKSVFVGNGVLSDIASGHGGALLDPKNDLVEAVLDRIASEHADRVVVLDPGDLTRPVPGIDVLHSGDPYACADVLVRTFKAMVPDWGIRSQVWGLLGLTTLCLAPGTTLAHLGQLYADDVFRRRALACVRDPFLLSQWQAYEALSPAARLDAVQAPLARVMALLSRPQVRAVLASPEPRLDIAGLLAQRRFILVALSPGPLGQAAPLIGAAVMFAIWSAIEKRAAVPPEQRHLINIYVDELATLTDGLPLGFEQIAERARGLGAGLTVALQSLARIPEPTRGALLANAASFVSWRAPGEEAIAIAKQLPGLHATDVVSLRRFEVAARVGTGLGSSVATVTGHTLPLPAPTGMAAAIRDATAARYGPRRTEPVVDTASDDGHEPLLGAERRFS
jgi:hypothetical protein